PVRAAVSQAPGNHSVARDPDTMGIGQNDWAFQKSALLHPGGAGHFAIAVQREIAGKNRIVHGIATTRENCRHAGADRAFADFEFTLAANESGIANLDTRDIANGVELSWGAIEWDAEITGANDFCVRFNFRGRWDGLAR